MIQKFVLKGELLSDDVEVTIACFKGLYYKVFLKTKKEEKPYVLKYKNFAELFEEHLKVNVENILLKRALDELEQMKGIEDD